jgi:hypothetical protein
MQGRFVGAVCKKRGPRGGIDVNGGARRLAALVAIRRCLRSWLAFQLPDQNSTGREAGSQRDRVPYSLAATEEGVKNVENTVEVIIDGLSVT